MDNNDLVEKLKILLIYGKRKVDGENKDGVEERIYKEEDDTVHFFYLKEFLQGKRKPVKKLTKSIDNFTVTRLSPRPTLRYFTYGILVVGLIYQRCFN